MSKKSKVFCEKPDEPAFIKRMKERIGYQAGPTIDSKKEELPKVPVDEDENEVDEEQPTIVVLKKGDLNEDEVKAIREEEDLTKQKKIIFKKPDKSSQEKKSDLIVSTTKRAAEEDRVDLLIKKHAVAKDNPIPKKPNLLSFNDDEDEEES